MAEPFVQWLINWAMGKALEPALNKAVQDAEAAVAAALVMGTMTAVGLLIMIFLAVALIRGRQPV
jgi:hypothetical protein